MEGLVKKITSGPTPQLPTQYSEEWRAVVRSLLSKDEAQRPSAADILKLPWLQVGRSCSLGWLPLIVDSGMHFPHAFRMA